MQKSQLKEWMKPVEAPVPRFLAKTGHKGMIYREPYGVALIIGPFNGPLLLLIRPALAALAAGNTCILTLSEALPATTEVLLELVPKYFDPSRRDRGARRQGAEHRTPETAVRLHLLHRQHHSSARSSRGRPRKTSRRSCSNSAG